MAASIVVPVNAPSLEQHEVLDNAAHVEIANTEDEDYKWLTDRLDELTNRLNQLQSSSVSQFENMNTLLSSNQEQSRLLIQSQSEMIQNLLQTVSQLSATALVSSTQAITTASESAQEPSQVVVTESAVENPAAIPANNAEEKPQKGRRRM